MDPLHIPSAHLRKNGGNCLKNTNHKGKSEKLIGMFIKRSLTRDRLSEVEDNELANIIIPFFRF